MYVTADTMTPPFNWGAVKGCPKVTWLTCREFAGICPLPPAGSASST